MRCRRFLARLLTCKIDPAARAADSRTALHVAASVGNITAARILLGHGCPVDVRDMWNRTPLEEAQDRRNVAVVQLLEEFRFSGMRDSVAAGT